MKNAAWLVGIWVGIILFAYSVVYLPSDDATRVALPGDAEIIDEQNGFALPLPVGWSAAALRDTARVTAPVAGVEVWAMSVEAGTAETALAAAWERADPCSSCVRPVVLETGPLTAGRAGGVLSLDADAEGRTGRAVVLLEGERARVLLIRLARDDSLPARVVSDLGRIEAGFRAVEALPEPSSDAQGAA